MRKDDSDAGRRALGATAADFRDLGDIAPLTEFPTRHGGRLGYRRYGQGDVALVFIHGSSADCDYLAPLGRAVAAIGLSVVTPTLRGHGANPTWRGDVDYNGQLLDDIDDLLVHLRDDWKTRRILIGGHSSGGGLALKYALERPSSAAAGLLLVAPFIHHRAPSARPGAGGWARPRIGRLALISMLNAFGITRFDDRPVVSFNVPPELRRPSTTDAYSFRMLASMSPGADWRQRLARMATPTVLIAGRDDGAFLAEGYDAAMSPAPRARVEILEGVSHMDIVLRPTGLDRIARAAQALAIAG